jgi:hypothetical protein
VPFETGTSILTARFVVAFGCAREKSPALGQDSDGKLMHQSRALRSMHQPRAISIAARVNCNVLRRIQRYDENLFEHSWGATTYF